MQCVTHPCYLYFDKVSGGDPARNRTGISGLEGPNAIRYTTEPSTFYPDGAKEENAQRVPTRS